MKKLGQPLLSIAAPLLIVLAVLAMTHRQGNDRLQTLPSFVVGFGLVISGAVGRRLRRNSLLTALDKRFFEEQ